MSEPSDLLVDELCALLSRSETRDLLDVRGLLGIGANLDRALEDAPRRDAGFSPLALAWSLRGLAVPALGRAAGLPEDEVVVLGRFRDDLISRLASRSRPDS